MISANYQHHISTLILYFLFFKNLTTLHKFANQKLREN